MTPQSFTDRNWPQLKSDILAHLASDKMNAVAFPTYTRCTVLTPKTVASFGKSGHDLIRANEKGIWIASGKNWICYNFTQPILTRYVKKSS